MTRLHFSLPNLLAIGLAAVVALGAALWLRYGLIDVTEIAQSCEAGEASLRCTVRMVFNQGFRTVFPGIVAVLIGLYTLVRPSVLLFGATIAAAAVCIVLFSAWPAGLAFTLALLSLARPARTARG